MESDEESFWESTSGKYAEAGDESPGTEDPEKSAAAAVFYERYVALASTSNTSR